jgi:hypothetical protein
MSDLVGRADGTNLARTLNDRLGARRDHDASMGVSL